MRKDVSFVSKDQYAKRIGGAASPERGGVALAVGAGTYLSRKRQRTKMPKFFPGNGQGMPLSGRFIPGLIRGSLLRHELMIKLCFKPHEVIGKWHTERAIFVELSLS